MADKEKNHLESLHDFHAAIGTVFDDVSEGVVDELTGIQLQIAQVESLLKDAIGSLYEGFEGISAEASVQMKVMTELMSQAVSSHDDTPNIFQRTESVSELLKQLVDICIDGSRGSLKALQTMEGMNQRMNKAIKSEASIQVNMQALEQWMASDAPDLIAMRSLMEEIKQQQAKHAQLLHSANGVAAESYHVIRDLASRDMDDVYQAKHEVEELLKHFYAITDYISSCRSEISLCNGRMRHHLGLAIRALQFEDITTQSLGHTRLHLERMEGFIVRMTQGLAQIQPQEMGGIHGYAQQIRAIHGEMMQYREELALDERNPVSQQNLDEGDVDLF